MHGVTKKCIRTAVVLCRSSSYHMTGSIYRRIYLRHFDVRNVSVSWNLAVIILVDVICISQIIQNSYILLSGTGLTPFPIAISNPPLPAGLSVPVPTLWYTGVWTVSSKMPHDGKWDRCKAQTLPWVPGERQISWLLSQGFGQSVHHKKWDFFSPPWNKNGLKKTNKHKPTRNPHLR